jgi:hypothetical protein
MDKPKLNFIIDFLMFLCLMAMAGLGFLMKYALPPGRQAWVKYGRNVDLTWLGWDRHDWGDIHLYLAFILLGLLVIHLYLHWQMILGLYARLLPDPQTRTRLAWAVLVFTVLVLLLPFLITPNVQERGRRGGGRGRVHSRLNIGPGPGVVLETPNQVYPGIATTIAGKPSLSLTS